MLKARKLSGAIRYVPSRNKVYTNNNTRYKNAMSLYGCLVLWDKSTQIK